MQQPVVFVFLHKRIERIVGMPDHTSPPKRPEEFAYFVADVIDRYVLPQRGVAAAEIAGRGWPIFVRAPQHAMIIRKRPADCRADALPSARAGADRQ